MEVHNGLSSSIVENLKIKSKHIIREFDVLFSSSETSSLSKGKPNLGLNDISSRLNIVNEIFEVTTKPMIFDANNGGDLVNFIFLIKSLERLGVSSIMINDGIKFNKNFIDKNDYSEKQETIENFTEKILATKKVKLNEGFMVLAGVTSLALKKGMKDALERTVNYIESGADAIIIHSKSDTPDEIIKYCLKYKNLKKDIPLIVIPTTFNSFLEEEMEKIGVKMVIYESHLLRIANIAMQNAAKSILRNGRSFEFERQF